MDLRAIWVCQCGCGGMMLSFDGENFYAHHFSFDFYTHQNKAKDFAAARAQYLKGDPTIAEIVINREDIDDLREFLENVKMSGGLKPYAERAASELKVVHLLGDLYAVWLEGKLPQTEVLKGNFYKMFECRLSPEDVDRLLYEIDRCVRLQELHEMPQGDSQHLRKFSKKLDKKTKKQESENASLNTVTDTAGEDEVESARGSAGKSAGNLTAEGDVKDGGMSEFDLKSESKNAEGKDALGIPVEADGQDRADAEILMEDAGNELAEEIEDGTAENENADGVQDDVDEIENFDDVIIEEDYEDEK